MILLVSSILKLYLQAETLCEDEDDAASMTLDEKIQMMRDKQDTYVYLLFVFMCACGLFVIPFLF